MSDEERLVLVDTLHDEDSPQRHNGDNMDTTSSIVVDRDEAKQPEHAPTTAGGDLKLSITVTGVQAVGVDSKEDYVSIEVECSKTKWVVVKSGNDIKAFHDSLANTLPQGEVSLRTLEEHYPFTHPCCSKRVQITPRDLNAIEKYFQVFTTGRGHLGNLASLDIVREFFALQKPFYFVRNDDVDGFKHCFMSLSGSIEDVFIMARDKANGTIFHYAACNRSSGIVLCVANCLSTKGRADEMLKMFKSSDVFGINPWELSRQFNSIVMFIDVFKLSGIDPSALEEFEDEKKEDSSTELRPPPQYFKAAETLSWRFVVNPVSGQSRAIRIYHDIIAPLLSLKGCRYIVSGLQS